MSRAIAASATTSSIGTTFAAASSVKRRSFRAPMRKARRAASQITRAFVSAPISASVLGRNCPPLPSGVPFGQPGCLGSSGLALPIAVSVPGALDRPKPSLISSSSASSAYRAHSSDSSGIFQMNGRDSRQALIVRVQRGGHGGEAGHQRINLRRASVEAGAGPEALDLGSLANDVSAALPHDKRRLADQ